MKELKLRFLDRPQANKVDPIEKILHDTGSKICEYAIGYFNYVVTTTSDVYRNQVEEASLYILIPAISYDYKIITLSYLDVERVKIQFFTLKTNQNEDVIANIKEGKDDLENKLNDLLNNSLADETFRFLINQVETKKESRKNIY